MAIAGINRRHHRAVIAVLAVLGALVIVAVVSLWRAHVPLPDQLPQSQATLVAAADGSPIGAIQGEQNRVDIPIEQVPEAVRDAVIAAEDRHYYSEPGISVTGIVRAGLSDLSRGRLAAGGSTITQQYVKNAYLNGQRTFARKIREAIIAVKLDRRYSKNTILGFYLNTIYFGRGSYGIEAAAETYFGVHASELSPAQAAVLAASIQAPEDLDPSTAPGPALTRWHYVVQGMVKDKALTADAAAALTYPPVRPRGAGGAAGRGALTGQTGYILDMVRSELLARGFSTQAIYTAGLRVRTTIRPTAQAAAVNAVDSVLKEPGDPQAALTAVEPGTGRILAVYGGADYQTRPFNNATMALRQPGSSFKPFVLAAALTNGISLRSTFDGRSPQTFPGYPQPVSNFGNEQFGSIDLVTATAASVNTVYVPLAEAAKLHDVVGAAHAAGIPDHTPPNGLQRAVPLVENPSIALGTSEVHPIDQAAAYATFAARGKAATPFVVQSVTDGRGHNRYQATPATSEAFTAGVAADLTYALEHVVTSGTGDPEARLDGGRPAAGKTGTTSDNKDAWFVGYTPSLSAAVWMGYDPKSPTDKSVLTDVEGVATVTGGTLPAHIWKLFMDAALAGTPVQSFPPPVFGGKPFTPTAASTTSTPSSSTTSESSTSSTEPTASTTSTSEPLPTTTEPATTTTSPAPTTTTTPAGQSPAGQSPAGQSPSG